MSTPYEIDITMSSDTATSLKNNGYQLYGFKSVQTSARGGAPLVWFVTGTFSVSTAVKWSEQYQAYTTNSSAISGGSVTASYSVNMDLGWIFDVSTSAGTGGTPGTGGNPKAITIENTSGDQFTAGISETVVNADGTSSSNPLCAFNLFGTTTLQIAPVEQVLLMFATDSYNTGTVVYNAFTNGLLIDLTQANLRSVKFDINAGWSSLPTAGASWAQQVSNNAPLAPLLIDTPAASATATLLKGGGTRRLSLVA
jgi:hypothetical protein